MEIRITEEENQKLNELIQEFISDNDINFHKVRQFKKELAIKYKFDLNNYDIDCLSGKIVRLIS